MAATTNPQTTELSATFAADVEKSLATWEATGSGRRLWSRDAGLWTGHDEASWLGWLDVAEGELSQASELKRFADEIKSAGFTNALLLGMGGSSLFPDVLAKALGSAQGYPELHVLDSTDPAQVKAAHDRSDLARTLFIVSSKSGSTLEPNVLEQYFFARAGTIAGAAGAGSRFIAITDPSSQLQRVAERDGFRRVFFGVPSIGGRFSALSKFGMVPAAVMGLDVPRFLGHAIEMTRACGAEVPAAANPGVTLGLVLGVAADQGRDKVTLIVSPRIASFGAWLEQLLAESTGKQGKALIPVDREEVAPPESYGTDRLFVYLRLKSAPDAKQDAAVAALARSGQPLIRISVDDPYTLGAEVFRWEIATAVVGARLGINPFDQPDVEASKVATRELTAAYERSGGLPAEEPFAIAGTIRLFADEKNVAALRSGLASPPSLSALLRAHLDRLRPGDYFAALAYIAMNDAHDEVLQSIRHAVRDRRRNATCVGFGPRFLHSTGQAYKGGPNSGVFLQITCDDAQELPIPGAKYGFGIVKAAQARGDFQVLAERGRRVLRVHLPADVKSGLEQLRDAVREALK